MKVLKSFLAGLFSLIFGVLVICIVYVFSISSFATKDNIVKSMESTDLLTNVNKIRNSGSGEGNNGVSQVIDEMYSLASQFSVSDEVVDSIIDSKITKQIIGEAVGNVTDYVVNGKDTKALSEDDVYNLINDNLDDILKASNVTLDEGQKEKFLREVKKQIPDIVEVIPTSESLVENGYGSEIVFVQDVFSTNTKIILCVLLVVSGLIVIIIKRKNFEWCANLGVTLLISSLVILGMGLLMPEFLVDMIGTTDLSLFASSIAVSLSRPIMYSGIGILVLSIILLIFYKVMESRSYRKIKS